MASRHFFSAAYSRLQPSAQRQEARVIEYPLLTVAEIMALLKRPSKWAVYRLIHRHEDPLPHRRVGRAVLFDQVELNEWTLRQRQGQAEPSQMIFSLVEKRR